MGAVSRENRRRGFKSESAMLRGTTIDRPQGGASAGVGQTRKVPDRAMTMGRILVPAELRQAGGGGGREGEFLSESDCHEIVPGDSKRLSLSNERRREQRKRTVFETTFPKRRRRLDTYAQRLTEPWRIRPSSVGVIHESMRRSCLGRKSRRSQLGSHSRTRPA